jgi:aspartyl protease family protein
MQQNDYMYYIYGIVLLIFLLVGFFSRKRSHNEPILTYVAIWIGVFAVLAIAYTIKDDIRQNLFPSHVVTEDGLLTVKRSTDGHFYIDAYLNNQKIHFLVDTGASSTVLTPSDARKIGININKLNFNQQYSTANGIVEGANTRIASFKIGNVEFKEIVVSVTTGELSISLLGMSVLENFDSYKFEGDMLYLKP